MFLSVIIPAYNESKRIRKTLDTLVEFFTDKNCKKFQGYYFSKPLSADRFEKIISNKFQF